MRFGTIDHPLTGIAVPISALRSARSCGVGEFPDLVALGAWAADVGIEIIQLLPVNDTGANSSPYSALSAFALHPLYLRLEDVPGAERYAAEIAAWRRKAEALPRLDFAGTLAFKRSVLERIHRDRSARISADADLAAWVEDNPWVRPYAAFRCSSTRTTARHGRPGAKRHPIRRPPSAPPGAGSPRSAGSTRGSSTRPTRSSPPRPGRSRRLGVRLKGDLPILMSGQSADVWHERRFFDSIPARGRASRHVLRARADVGLPRLRLERHGRRRVRVVEGAARAGRRASSTPSASTTCSASSGSGRCPRPSRTACSAGSTPRRRAPGPTSRPRASTTRRSAGSRCPTCGATTCGHGSARTPTGLPGGTCAASAPRSSSTSATGSTARTRSVPSTSREAVREALYRWHADRALLAAGTDRFFPSWYHERSQAFVALDEARRRRLQDLFRERRAASERTWERRGRDLLAMVSDASDMLVCAEDLGDVPDCVPAGARRPRHPRPAHRALGPGVEATRAARSSIPPEYPALTVCTPSVHDTSTLRGWWEEDRAERAGLLPAAGARWRVPRAAHAGGRTPRSWSAASARARVSACSSSRSCSTSIRGSGRPTRARDRINVPGTVADTNWTWRMPLDDRVAGRNGPSSRTGCARWWTAPAAADKGRCGDGGSRVLGIPLLAVGAAALRSARGARRRIRPARWTSRQPGSSPRSSARAARTSWRPRW